VFVKKVSASEPLTRRRKGKTMSKPRFNIVLGTSSKAICLPLLRHPTYRRHELGMGFYMERENLSLR